MNDARQTAIKNYVQRNLFKNLKVSARIPPVSMLMQSNCPSIILAVLIMRFVLLPAPMAPARGVQSKATRRRS